MHAKLVALHIHALDEHGFFDEQLQYILERISTAICPSKYMGASPLLSSSHPCSSGDSSTGFRLLAFIHILH